jgi:hypothetical protein
MNTCRRNGFTAPFILHRGTHGSWMVSHKPRPLYPREEIPGDPMGFCLYSCCVLRVGYVKRLLAP